MFPLLREARRKATHFGAKRRKRLHRNFGLRPNLAMTDY